MSAAAPEFDGMNNNVKKSNEINNTRTVVCVNNNVSSDKDKKSDASASSGSTTIKVKSVIPRRK